jgi:hypothetical protein
MLGHLIIFRDETVLAQERARRLSRLVNFVPGFLDCPDFAFDLGSAAPGDDGDHAIHLS